MAGQLPEWIEQLPGPAGPMPEWLERMTDGAAPVFEAKSRAYRRPGSHHMLTAEQWALHDRAMALQERQRARFGGALERAGVAHLGPVFGGTGLTRGRMLL